jgi:rod shape-determining protein MreB
MHGKTHENIKTIRPLRDGVIADFDAAEQMIRGMIKMINTKPKMFNPALKMVVCIPSGATEVERRAVRDSSEHAGGRDVYMIYEPMAAAIGIGIDVEAPVGSMVVDVGGGTTEIAVISLGGIVCNQSIRVAGDGFTADIQAYMRHQHNIKIGERTAEDVKINVGSSKIETSILEVLEQTPPELYADVVNRGIYMAGGGALLRGLAKRFTDKINIPFHMAEDPLQAIARGTGIALKNVDKFSFLMR